MIFIVILVGIVILLASGTSDTCVEKFHGETFVGPCKDFEDAKRETQIIMNLPVASPTKIVADPITVLPDSRVLPSPVEGTVSGPTSPANINSDSNATSDNRLNSVINGTIASEPSPAKSEEPPSPSGVQSMNPKKDLVQFIHRTQNLTDEDSMKYWHFASVDLDEDGSPEILLLTGGGLGEDKALRTRLNLERIRLAWEWRPTELLSATHPSRGVLMRSVPPRGRDCVKTIRSRPDEFITRGEGERKLKR